MIDFCLYTFLGYCMESLYVSLIHRRFISSGLLKGPFVPLYGFGACTLLLVKDYLTHTFSQFLVGMILMTLIEYLCSFYIERVFHKRCWDYSHHKFHYQGRICLFYTIIWGLLSWLLLSYIHPFLSIYIVQNDLNSILCFIYLSYLLKAFVSKLHHNDNMTLLKPKEKESVDSLS